MGGTPFGVTGKALARLQLALIVAPSFILFGYNQAGIGGLLTEEDWVKTFPEIDTVNYTGATKTKHSTIQGVVVAVFVIGALFGSLSAGWSGNAFGRRNVVFAGGIFTLIGSVLEASSFSLAQFIVGRIILGAGVGQLSSIVPVWLSETSSAANRGRQVVLTGLFICLGYVLESWINLGFFEFKTGPRTWRPPIAISIFFSLVLIASIYFFPESPRWLVMKNRSEQARSVVAALRGLPEDAPEVQIEVAGIEFSLEETAGTAVKLTDMLKMGEDKLLYRFMLCILLQFYQQMSGSNLVSVYAPILFQSNLGLPAETAKALAGGALTWKFLSSFLAFFCIDRLGLAPIRLRMAMSSISTANHWLWNFVVALATPVALETIGWQYYIVFAVISALIPVSVIFFYPETKGRSLEELDMIFKTSPSVLGTVRHAKNQPPAMPQEYLEKVDQKQIEHS
ncbi:hypothetical protein LQW54_004594 [Pestalotiopsis sp. IQ-011]